MRLYELNHRYVGEKQELVKIGDGLRVEMEGLRNRVRQYGVDVE